MKSYFNVKPAGTCQTYKVPFQHVQNWENTLTSHLALMTQSELLLQQRRQSGLTWHGAHKQHPYNCHPVLQSQTQHLPGEEIWEICELELELGSLRAQGHSVEWSTRRPTGLAGNHQ